MFTSLRTRLALPAVLLLAALMLPMSASAHERRTIAGGKYDVVVGWELEPAWVDLRNAALIRVFKGGSNPAEPIEGVDRTLKVQIRQGATTKEFTLRAASGQPGTYVTEVLPTRTGDYQFSFVGTINGDQINERFDSADGKFDSIKPATEIQFPVALPDPASSITAVQQAQSEAQSARTLAYLGIGVGVLGLVAGAAAWATRPRAPGIVTGRSAAERP